MNTIMLQAAAAQGSNFSMIIMMVAIFAVMYFFMIRPQQKKQKEITKWRESIQKGEKVITNGGIYGKVKGTDGGVLIIEIAKDIEIRVDRNFVMRDASDAVQK